MVTRCLLGVDLGAALKLLPAGRSKRLVSEDEETPQVASETRDPPEVPRHVSAEGASDTVTLAMISLGHWCAGEMT